MLKPIVILGIGGHAQEVAWIIDDINAAAPEWNLLGFVDTVNSGKKELYGRSVLGGYEAVCANHGKPFFACGVGTPAIRAKESKLAEESGWRPVSLVHPSAIRARFVAIEYGSTIAAGCVIGPNARIGKYCLLNTQCTVAHDAVIGDYSVVSPGARILGGVKLDEDVFVGSNASVYQGVHVGAGSTLAANSFLKSDLEPGQSIFGRCRSQVS